MTSFDIRIKHRQSGKTTELKKNYYELDAHNEDVYFIVPRRNMKVQGIERCRTFEELIPNPNHILLVDEMFILSELEILKYKEIFKP